MAGRARCRGAGSPRRRAGRGRRCRAWRRRGRCGSGRCGARRRGARRSGGGQSFGDQDRDGLLGRGQARPAVPRPSAGSLAAVADAQAAQGRVDAGEVAGGAEPFVAGERLVQEGDGAAGAGLPGEGVAGFLAGKCVLERARPARVGVSGAAQRRGVVFGQALAAQRRAGQRSGVVSGCDVCYRGRAVSRAREVSPAARARRMRSGPSTGYSSASPDRAHWSHTRASSA